MNGLISDIETPAFGYDKKLIIVKNSNILKKEKKSNTKSNTDLQKKISEYIKENIKRDAFSEYERVPFMRPLDKRRILKSYRINYFV